MLISVASFIYHTENPYGRVGEKIYIDIFKSGSDIVHDPLYNKDIAFTIEERERCGVRGLVPPRYFTSEKGIEPTVGEACQKFSTMFRRTRGMFFSSHDRGAMHSMTHNWPIDDVQVIVITDGSRILGLGDLGANGMGISIGKLSLYTACAGIHPALTLPICLDVGTNNKTLQDSDYYIGLPEPRKTGDEYNEIVDEALSAIVQRWPKALIQFEDFENSHALPILTRYKKKFLCFNDDIQGTGAMNFAGLLGAMRVVEKNADPVETMAKKKILICGAGTTGCGIAHAIVSGLRTEFPDSNPAENIYLYDKDGLLGKGRKGLHGSQKAFKSDSLADGLDLLESVKQIKPDVIIGVSGVGGLFTEEIIKEMAQHAEKPVIFPLSNPTSSAECTAEEAYTWTDGKCVFASGSPFDPVSLDGIVHRPNQANNMYTFPGIGLGSLASNARIVSDGMLYACSRSLASQLTTEELNRGQIFPDLNDIRSTSFRIAVDVFNQALKEDLSRLDVEVKPAVNDTEGIENVINTFVWEPRYGCFVRDNVG